MPLTSPLGDRSIPMDGKGCLSRVNAYYRKNLAILAAWSATIGALVWWYHVDHEDNMIEMARIYARAYLERDMIYRQWDSAHDGMCVAASKTVRSDLLPRSLRLNAASPGHVHTSLNPARIRRQDDERVTNGGDLHPRVTSLKPVNAKHEPDTWERDALLAFAKGEKEASDVHEIAGTHTARLMRPIYIEESCLSCHDRQGYEIGDVRGGVSVTVPVDSIWKAGAQQARNVFLALGGIWTLGAVAIVLVGRATNHRRIEREQSIESLAKKQEFLNAVLDNIRDGIVACDADGILTLFNPATRQFHGLPVKPLPADQWPRHFDLYLPDGATLMKKEDVPLYRCFGAKRFRIRRWSLHRSMVRPVACSRTDSS